MAEQTDEPESQTEQPAHAAQEADPRAELEAARARADEMFRSWQRSAADFANFKRRIDEEKRFSERWLLGDLLAILDDFERAWVSAPPEMTRFTWVEGVYQVYAKLAAVMQRHGLTPIEAQGKEFNPLEHEAVMRDESVELAEQTHVVGELQRGYRLHERVLRAALVKVGPPPPSSGEAAATAEPQGPTANEDLGGEMFDAASQSTGADETPT
jgi:molecular chaperone GrpE